MKRTSLMIMALGLFLFAQAAQADWTQAKRLTWTSGSSECPVIAVDSSGNLHVVWQDNYEIYYKKSADGGTTWTPSQRLTWSTGLSMDSAIAVDSSGNLHVVWADNTPGEYNYEIYYKKSTDGGATWTQSKRLIWTSGSSVVPDIAVDAFGNLHVVWQDCTPGNFEIYYKKSTDGGATWTQSKRLTWTSVYSGVPDIAVDAFGNLHVVWGDYFQIYYKKSTDGGANWTTNKRLTWTSGDCDRSAIGVDPSGNLHVVWGANAPGNFEIYYKKSTDGGANWTTNKRLTWTSGQSMHPAMAIDSSGDLHVAWEDYTPGNAEIYYRKSVDEGATWTSTQRITWTSGESFWPDIAIDSSGHLHIVWDDSSPGNYEIYYKNGK